jgi:hypothetical protein
LLDPQEYHPRGNYVLHGWAVLMADSTVADWKVWSAMMAWLFGQAGIYADMRHVVEGTEAVESDPMSKAATGRRTLPCEESSEYHRLAIGRTLISRAINPLWRLCLRDGLELRHPHDMWQALERWCVD